MTDEEQLALALQMSMQADVQEMETDSAAMSTSAQASSEPTQENAEFDELAENQEFLEVWLLNMFCICIVFFVYSGSVKKH